MKFYQTVQPLRIDFMASRLCCCSLKIHFSPLLSHSVRDYVSLFCWIQKVVGGADMWYLSTEVLHHSARASPFLFSIIRPLIDRREAPPAAGSPKWRSRCRRAIVTMRELQHKWGKMFVVVNQWDLGVLCYDDIICPTLTGIVNNAWHIIALQ